MGERLVQGGKSSAGRWSWVRPLAQLFIGLFLLLFYGLSLFFYHGVIICRKIPSLYELALANQLGYMSTEDFIDRNPDDPKEQKCPTGGKLFEMSSCSDFHRQRRLEYSLCGRWYFARCADLAAPVWALERPEVAAAQLKVAYDPCGSLPKAEDVRAQIEKTDATEERYLGYLHGLVWIIERCPQENLPVVLRYYDEKGRVVARMDIPERKGYAGRPKGRVDRR